jgi:hypothetical protein
MRTFRAGLAVVGVAVCGTVASAQNADGPASIQPVPGAMPNTDDVPSALSPKNAQAVYRMAAGRRCSRSQQAISVSMVRVTQLEQDGFTLIYE